MQVKNLLSAVPRMIFSNAPLDAQLIVTRRCNLSCGYCNEYDNVSEPVPVEDLKRRIDALHRLGAANITLLGGEPLMHPDIAEIVVYAGHRSNVSLVTNGFLLRNSVIESLNQAGLNNLTVSVDTLNADLTRYIQKSFRSLKTRLERLRQLAKFDVHVTAVLCESSRDDFRQLVDEVQGMGFRMSINLIHNSKGYVAVRGQPYLDLFEDFYRTGEPFTFLDYEYGKKLLQGETPDWKCRAGARYMYVDEHGKVQLCASQLGRLGKPIEEYTRANLNEQANTYKGCEEGCSVGCAFRCSILDNDKPAFVRSVLKGYLRGSMFDNGRRNRTPRLQGKPAPEVATIDD
ncbi:MAG TPA: radical SAM protein [Dehalococcoidia bacterium]|nr:radical SAM protein [Dehalococcoidia bacterium]